MRIDKAMRVMAERIYDNNRDLSQSKKQRRNQVVDMYGVPFYGEGDAANPMKVYISTSSDLIYYQRFQFWIALRNANNSNPQNFRISLEGVDLTPYLMAQQDGEWIGWNQSEDNLYPASHILSDDDPSSAYDILEAADTMMGEGKVSNADTVLRSGRKLELVISANAPFSVTLYLYLKYSHMAR